MDLQSSWINLLAWNEFFVLRIGGLMFLGLFVYGTQGYRRPWPTTPLRKAANSGNRPDRALPAEFKINLLRAAQGSYADQRCSPENSLRLSSRRFFCAASETENLFPAMQTIAIVTLQKVPSLARLRVRHCSRISSRKISPYFSNFAAPTP